MVALNENNASQEVNQDAPEAPSSLKAKANALFMEGEFSEAIGKYEEAIKLLEEQGSSKENDALKAVLNSNISASYYKLKDYENSLKYSKLSLFFKKNYSKALNRKAQALLSLEKPNEALEALNECLISLSHEKKPNKPLMKTIQKQILTLEQSLKKSAVKKIEEYCDEHKTFKGCETKASSSMFTLMSVLAEGNYSHIYKGRFNYTKEIFALKEFVKRKIDRMSRRNQNVKDEIKSEVKILLALKKKIKDAKEKGDNTGNHIVELLQAFEDNSNIYFCYEYVNGGEVWQRLRYFNKFNKQLGLKMCELSPTDAYFYLSQLVAGIKFLHRNGIIHRDLKPENLLVQIGNGQDITDWNNIERGNVEILKIVDFGTAVFSDLDKKHGEKVSNFAGTPEYMSAEAIKGLKPTDRVDLWAFASTAFQLYSGLIPFKAATPYLGYQKVRALHYHIPNIVPKAVLRGSIESFSSYPENRNPDATYGFFEPKLECGYIKPVKTLKELALEFLGDKITAVRYNAQDELGYIGEKFERLGLKPGLFSEYKLGKVEYRAEINGVSVQFHKREDFNKESYFWNKSMHNVKYPKTPLSFLPEETVPAHHVVCGSPLNVGKVLQQYLSSRGFLRFHSLRDLFEVKDGYDAELGYPFFDVNARFMKMFNILFLPNTKYSEALIARINTVKEHHPKIILAHNHNNVNSTVLDKLLHKYKDGLVILNSPEAKKYFSFAFEGVKIIKIDSESLNKVPTSFIKFFHRVNSKPKKTEKVKEDKKAKQRTSEASSESESDESDYEEEKAEINFANESEKTDSYDYSAVSDIEASGMEQFLWLHHELLSGEYNFRHCMIISELPFSDHLPNHLHFHEQMMRKPIQEFFIPRMKKANTHLVLVSGDFSEENAKDNSHINHRFKEEKSGMYEMRMEHAYFEPKSDDKINVRWIKVLDTSIKSELFNEDTLPKYLIISEKKYENEGQVRGTGVTFDSFSSSSEQDSDSESSDESN
eukprot:augustus_masked-scaffold_7-processed-gene-5.12-mRNA-1 protein AED:1.00 eAED:1.00 QI:0/-1/0/0/-1/1/1/0/990